MEIKETPTFASCEVEETSRLLALVGLGVENKPEAKSASRRKTNRRRDTYPSLHLRIHIAGLLGLENLQLPEPFAGIATKNNRVNGRYKRFKVGRTYHT